MLVEQPGTRFDKHCRLAGDPDGHAKLAEPEHAAVDRIIRKDRCAMAAIVDLPDLCLMPAVAAAIVDRVFLQQCPVVGKDLFLENADTIVLRRLRRSRAARYRKQRESQAASSRASRAMSSISAIA